MTISNKHSRYETGGLPSGKGKKSSTLANQDPVQLYSTDFFKICMYLYSNTFVTSAVNLNRGQDKPSYYLDKITVLLLFWNLSNYTLNFSH